MKHLHVEVLSYRIKDCTLKCHHKFSTCADFGEIIHH